MSAGGVYSPDDPTFYVLMSCGIECGSEYEAIQHALSLSEKYPLCKFQVCELRYNVSYPPGKGGGDSRVA